MHQTSRIRVLSDRIPRALVFIYFCRELSENMERRPTCHVYNEIITCRAIFLNLEESRSHGNEWETERARGQGTRPPPLGACPGLDSNQNSFRGPSSTDLKDESKPCNQGRFDPTAQIHQKGLYNQGLSTPGREENRRNHYQRQPSKLGFRASLPQGIRISYSLIHQVQRIDQIAIREVEHYALDSDLR